MMLLLFLMLKAGRLLFLAYQWKIFLLGAIISLSVLDSGCGSTGLSHALTADGVVLGFRDGSGGAAGQRLDDRFVEGLGLLNGDADVHLVSLVVLVVHGYVVRLSVGDHC